MKESRCGPPCSVILDTESSFTSFSWLSSFVFALPWHLDEKDDAGLLPVAKRGQRREEKNWRRKSCKKASIK
jgi:hypothetical protein